MLSVVGLRQPTGHWFSLVTVGRLVQLQTLVNAITFQLSCPTDPVTEGRSRTISAIHSQGRQAGRQTGTLWLSIGHTWLDFCDEKVYGCDHGPTTELQETTGNNLPKTFWQSGNLAICHFRAIHIRTIKSLWDELDLARNFRILS